MSQEIAKPDAAPESTSDVHHEFRGLRLDTPVGELVLSLRTPISNRFQMSRFPDPFGIAGRAMGLARFGVKVASWTEDQLISLLRSRLDAVGPAPLALKASEPGETKNDTLNTKMSRLLDRALDQSTRGSQAELYHRMIDQLVADEARIIGALSDGSASPLVNIHAWTRARVPGRAVLENASLIGRTANVALPNMVPQYVGHLLSLGLVETGPEDPGMKTDYEVLMAESMVLRAIKSASIGPVSARVEKLTLSLSGMGQALWAAAMQGDDG
jgi:hypothetical protein